MYYLGNGMHKVKGKVFFLDFLSFALFYSNLNESKKVELASVEWNKELFNGTGALELFGCRQKLNFLSRGFSPGRFPFQFVCVIFRKY